MNDFDVQIRRFVQLNGGRFRALPWSAGAGRCGASQRKSGASRWLAGVVAICCLSAVLSGCQSLSGGTYRAASLPAQFQAPPPSSIRDLELSRLSRNTGASQQIQPGDLLQVAIATGLEEVDPPPRDVRVDNAGQAVLPLVGPVRLAGLELPAAEGVIHHESVQRGVYRNPQVSVFLKEKLHHNISVMGAVTEPGVKQLPADSCGLMEALLAAGLEDDADTIVELRYPPQPGRPEGNTVVVDLRTLVSQGGDYRLPDGAVVNVRQRPRQTVSVIGLVHKPGHVEIPPGRPLTLLDAVAAAGGRSLQIADKVKVIRQAPNLREPLIISASFKRAKQQSGSADNLPLMAGDIISIEETAATFTIDTLRSFLRFGFSSAVPGL